MTAADRSEDGHTRIVWCPRCLITPPSRNCKRHGHPVIDAVVVPADSWRLRSDFQVSPIGSRGGAE